MGCRLVVLERQDKPRGSLWVIPKFRIPESTLAWDVERIERLGVKIEYGGDLGKDLSFSDI